MKRLGILFITLSASAVVAACTTGAVSDDPPVTTAGQATVVEVVDGFVHPESALYDPASASWYVSNMGEQQVAGDGFISRLSADRKMLDTSWVGGLNDPAGMAIHEGVLYVADGARVGAVTLADRTVAWTPVPGAAFLNDIAVDPSNGDVYVSDTFGNAIFRWRAGAVETLLRDPALEAPNGLAVDGGTLWVASIGPDLDPQTFQPSKPGRLSRVDLATGLLTPFGPRFGGLDGIVLDGDQLVVSDTFAGLYIVDTKGDADPIVTPIGAAETLGLTGVADIGRQGGLVAVPELFGSEVSFVAVPQLSRN